MRDARNTRRGRRWSPDSITVDQLANRCSPGTATALARFDACDRRSRAQQRLLEPSRRILSARTPLHWLAVFLLFGVGEFHVYAQDAEPVLPRPGAIYVVDVIGEATAIAGEQRKPIKSDERLRVGSTIVTERMSIVTLVLSNGATLRLGSESELELEEFGQATIPGSLKIAELKAEPTVSRTRLRLVRGDVKVDVKPLNVARGSSFMLSLLAGTVRSTDGTFHARMRMSDLGLGVCTIELEKGAAEFEPVDGKFAPLAVGRELAVAIEIDRITTLPKIIEMPKGVPKATKVK